MAAKADLFYFQNLLEAADYACQAAEYLVTCISDYNSENALTMLEKMHTFEHQGDSVRHAMSNALAKAFITPVDREDLAFLSQSVDDVTDSIEEVLQCIYMYKIQTVTPEAITFAQNILNCCKLMKHVLTEFPNFKKPGKLHEQIVTLCHAEEECDTLYIKATMLLDTRCNNILDIISWRDIYTRMENCADASEHVATCVETVVMKNS